MTDNLYRCTPRQVRALASETLEAGLVPFVRSSPGMGKSSIFRGIGNNWNLWLIDHRASTSAPEDLSGLPEFYTDQAGIRRARFAPFDIFPVEGTPLPDGKDGWLLFFDEFNSATKMVQAAMYKIILDRMVGQHMLHQRVAICAAGNLMSDRAIVERMSTAMQSRLIHFEMQLSHREWLEDVALIEEYDERIIAFLNFNEKHLMDFKPDHDENTFCCPRTWEFMNKLIKGKHVNVDKTPLYAGTITSGVAAEFVGFCQLQKELLTIKDVLANPDTAPVPNDAQRKWIITSHLIGKVTDKNFGDICKYMKRFDLAFRVLFFRAAMVTKPELRSHPDFALAMVELQRYLNGK